MHINPPRARLEPNRGNAPRFPAYEAGIVLDGRAVWSSPTESNCDPTLIRRVS
jgi:hypothetical protein